MTRPLRVLVVDDDALMRRLICDALTGSRESYDPERFEVVSAAAAEEALFIAFADVPDLILVDYVLPDTNGAELVRALRAENRWKPVIGYSGIDKGSEMLRAGACAFLPKPFTPDQLIAAITQVMERCGPATECPCLSHARRENPTP